VDYPGGTELEERIRQAVRRLNWEEATEAAQTLEREVQEALGRAAEDRRSHLGARGDQLFQSGFPLDAEGVGLYEKVDDALGRKAYGEALGYLDQLGRLMTEAQLRQRGELEHRLRELIQWAGVEERTPAILEAVQASLAKASEADLPGAESSLELQLEELLPEAMGRWKALRTECEELVRLARDLGVASGGLEQQLQATANARPLGLETYAGRLAEERSRVEASIRQILEVKFDDYRQVLEELGSEGDGQEEYLKALASVSERVPNARGMELSTLLGEGLQAVQAPVVSLVASCFDEARPLMAEARRLGRNTIPLVQEMNRAREGLRTLEFRPAIKAARHVLEAASELVADVQAAREDLDAFRELLARLSASGMRTTELEGYGRRAEEALGQNLLDKVREALDEGIRMVGREALPYLRGRLSTAGTLLSRLEKRGLPVQPYFLKLEEIRRTFEEGLFPEAAEGVFKLFAEVRLATLPILSTRLEELRQALEKLPEGPGRMELRRSLAESDLALKVKEDLESALANLEAAEKGLGEAFARESEHLVSELEDERRRLEELGVGTEEAQREIALVRQIFSLGDFLRGSQASQEIRSRILQQQLVRAEEAISRAKFSLVELGKMGLEPASLRTALGEATDRVRAGQYPEAFHHALQVREEAVRLKGTAQDVLDATVRVADLMVALRKAGVDPETFREFAPRLDQARAAYQRLDFEKARALSEEVRGELERISSRREGLHEAEDLARLLEGARLLGIDDPVWEGSLTELREMLGTAQAPEALDRLKELREAMRETLRGTLEEQLQGLESDLRSARALGMDTRGEEAALREAYRRLSEPLPLGVAEIIDRSRREFFQSRGFREQGVATLKRAREAVSQAEMVRAPVGDLKARLEALDAPAGEGAELSERLEAARQLTQEALELTQSQVAKTLNNFQSMINRAKMEGALTMVAENLLVQARSLLGAGKPLEALQLASRSEAELERVELQHALASNALITLETKLEDAERSHISSPQAREELERAKDLLARGDYAGVLERTMEGGDRLLAAQQGRREALTALDRTSQYLGTLEVLGEGIQGLRGLVEEGRRHFDQGRYREAKEAAEAAYEQGRSALEALLDSRRREVEAVYSEARSLYPDQFGEAHDPLAPAQEALVRQDWAGALRALGEAEAQARTRASSLAEEEIRALEAQWAQEPVQDPREEAIRQETLRAARAAVADHRLAEVRPALERGRQEALALRRQALEREISALEERVLLGERLGVDTTPVMEVFSEAKMELAAGNLASSASCRKRTEETLEGLLRQRLPEVLQSLNSETAFAKEGLGVEVGPVEALLSRVEGQQSAGEVYAAALGLVEAEAELNRRRGLHHRLTNLQYMVEAALGQAESGNADVGRLRERLKEALTLRSEDYERALRATQELLEEVRGLGRSGS
jgi:hypothetical protein